MQDGHAPFAHAARQRRYDYRPAAEGGNKKPSVLRLPGYRHDDGCSY